MHRGINNQTRDTALKQRLDPDKVKLLDKYGLHADNHDVWIFDRENSFPARFAKQSFIEESDILRIVFRVYSLCSAKLRYYRDNWDKYEPYIHDVDRGFIPAEIWNMEFLQHRPSGKFIDLRYLQRIFNIDDFRGFCRKLEALEGAE